MEIGAEIALGLRIGSEGRLLSFQCYDEPNENLPGSKDPVLSALHRKLEFGAILANAPVRMKAETEEC